ncbi:MAG: hypothetical protein Fur0032_00240 [Terrimicrobiaceae bacterium]
MRLQGLEKRMSEEAPPFPFLALHDAVQNGERGVPSRQQAEKGVKHWLGASDFDEIGHFGWRFPQSAVQEKTCFGQEWSE